MISKDTHLVFSIYRKPRSSTSVLEALPGKLAIKRHSPSILYISANPAIPQAFSKPYLVTLISYSLYLDKPGDSTSVLTALPGKLDIKRHSPSILYISASLAMSTHILKAFPGKLDIQRHLVFSMSRQDSLCQQAFSKPYLVNLCSKDTHIVFFISWQADSKCVLEALPIKLYILRHSSSFLYISANPAIQQVFSKPCLVNLISKDTHLVFSISRRASRCQQGLLKPYLVNLISKDTHLVFFFYLDMPRDSTSVLEDLPGKLDIKRHSPNMVFSIIKCIVVL